MKIHAQCLRDCRWVNLMLLALFYLFIFLQQEQHSPLTTDITSVFNLQSDITPLGG